ncbi:DUF4013 domain-containing protein [Methanobrevibacter sp.]
MQLGAIISNSFKYPFKDLKHLICIFILYALILVFPLGHVFNNDYIEILGLATFAVFILIFPGLMVLVTKSGINESSKIPLKIGKSIVNTFKLLLLYICYLLIPVIIAFLIISFATGMWNVPLSIINESVNLTMTPDMVLEFFQSLYITFVGVLIVSWLFSLIYYIAKARMANFNSLVEALKIHKVFRDIKQISFSKFIAWYLVMMIILTIINSIMIFVLFIPYVGFIIYLCILNPILTIIFYYSLGLLYSEVSDEKEDELDLDKFEKEIEYLKYRGIR